MLGLGLSLSSTPVIGGAINAPSFALDFRNGDNPVTKYGFTFTRATTATYVNSAGLLATAASGELRYDYDPVTLAPRGILVEEASTNLVLASNDYGSASWNANADVTVAGELITEGSAGTALISQYVNVVSGSTMTHSLSLKYGNADWVRVGVVEAGTSNQYRCWVNLATGELGTVANAGVATGATARITNQGGGWYRVAITGAIPGCTVYSPYTVAASADNSTTRVSGATRYQRYSQFEAKAFATSYIPTTGAAATRNADALTLTGAAGRTNLVTYSALLNTSPWACNTGAGTLVATEGAAAAPDGSITATLLTATAATFPRNVQTLTNTAMPPSTEFTFSIYCKAGTFDYITLFVRNGTGDPVIVMNTFRFSTQTLTAVTGSVGTWSSVGNGWYRISITGTRSVGTSGGGMWITPGQDYSTTARSGTVYVWGAQLETGSSATTYIPTTNGPRTVENVASWFNWDAGTWVVHGRRNDSSAAVVRRMVSAGNAAGTQSINLAVNTNADSALNVVANSAAQAAVAYAMTYGITSHKVAAAYAVNDFQQATDGALATADTSGALPYSFGNVYLGDLGTAAAHWNGTIAYLAYYPRRLSNAALQALTA